MRFYSDGRIDIRLGRLGDARDDGLGIRRDHFDGARRGRRDPTPADEEL